MSVLNRVKKYIEENNMIKMEDSVIVGLSGGADSICLAEILHRLSKDIGFKLVAVHVHHGIRGKEADRDKEFVEKYCESKGIVCKIFYHNIPEVAKIEKMTEEEAGRKVRYEDFSLVNEELFFGKGKIAIAHNKNDNVETFVHNLCRGTSITGLAGIRKINGNIIRPIMCLTRTDIEKYLNEKGVKYINDSTNFSTEYTRNKIRLKVLPYLEENINDKSLTHIGNVLEDLCELEEYIERQTKILWDKYFKVDKLDKFIVRVDKNILIDMEEVIAKRLIRRAILEVAGRLKDISRKNILDCYQILHNQSGKSVMLPYDIIVRTTQKDFIVERADSEKSTPKENVDEIEIAVDKGKLYKNGQVSIETRFDIYNISVKIFKVDSHTEFNEEVQNLIKNKENRCTKCFDYDKIKGIVSVRTRKAGDYLSISNQNVATGYSEKKLKEYFINEKIPVDERNKLMLFADGNHILWVYGHRISEYYKVTGETVTVMVINVERNTYEK